MKPCREDCHIHSVVSDGTMTPAEIIRTAARLGLKRISITDHDAVGAYTHFPGDPVRAAGKRGIEMVTGVELDCTYRQQETHILGYGLDPENPFLQQYLQKVKDFRRRRIKELIAGINRALGRKILAETEILQPCRDTPMKPHVLRPLVSRGIFPGYSDAARWLSREVKVTCTVPKPPVQETISLIRKAGGKPVLAHPGFRILLDSVPAEKMIREMADYGIAGVEVYYPYRLSEQGITDADLLALSRRLLDLCKRYRLIATRGSDSHSISEMERYWDGS